MKFNTETPNSERVILVLCNDGEGDYMIQGQFYVEENDYYSHDGEMLSAIAWAERPEIEY